MKKKNKHLKIEIKMSFNLKTTRNNLNLIEFNKEKEMLEEKTIGQHNNYKIPFKREPVDNLLVDFSHSNLERIKQLESKINDLNEIIHVKSKEIIDLKFKLNKYEPQSNEIISTRETDIDQREKDKQSEQKILNLEQESYDDKMSTCESDTDSDQSDDETTNKVINIIFFY